MSDYRDVSKFAMMKLLSKANPSSGFINSNDEGIPLATIQNMLNPQQSNEQQSVPVAKINIPTSNFYTRATSGNDFHTPMPVCTKVSNLVTNKMEFLILQESVMCVLIEGNNVPVIDFGRMETINPFLKECVHLKMPKGMIQFGHYFDSIYLPKELVQIEKVTPIKHDVQKNILLKG